MRAVSFAAVAVASAVAIGSLDGVAARVRAGGAQSGPPGHCGAPPADVAAITREVRENLRRDYSTPRPFRWLEKRRDVDISRLGKVSVGPLRTFEVYPGVVDDYKRLIAIDGKPLDPAELARRDAEHQENLRKKAEREQTESPSRRAARLAREAEEVRERDAIIEDASRVFAFTFECRETLDGEPMLVFNIKPRPDARVTTREGGWMKRSEGRIWISERGHHIARVQFTAFDDLSIGWGMVARIDAGSGFEYVRTKVNDVWLPAKLVMAGSGKTLLFRRFEVKTVTTFTDHHPYPQASSSPPG